MDQNANEIPLGTIFRCRCRDAAENNVRCRNSDGNNDAVDSILWLRCQNHIVELGGVYQTIRLHLLAPLIVFDYAVVQTTPPQIIIAASQGQ